jgi:molybdopterin synthase catalytic subunit
LQVEVRQDVETGCQLRSRFVQRLNVQNDVRLASSLAAALPDSQCFIREPYMSASVQGDGDMFVRVQRENFSIDRELDRVKSRSKRIGGIATFLGIARDRSKGRDVDGITFEYYEGMAQKKLREIRERALKDFDILELLIIHRYGEITIGENIVLIIAGAEHRAEAFRACKWAIDELKQITPIWKLEHTPEGEVWVEEHP